MRNKSIHHWFTIAACCGLSASSIGICVNSLGVFFPSASAELGVGKGAFALHATISNLVTGLFAPFGMRILRKYNFRVVVGAAILLAGGSTMLMSLGGNVGIFYVLGALRGIGCAFFALVVITFVIGNWFDEKHGFAVGLTLSFSGLSGALFSPIFSRLIFIIGWRYAYVAMGLAIILLAFPGAILLDPFPEMKGLFPYGKKDRETPSTPRMKAPGGKTSLPAATFLSVMTLAVLVSSITGIAQHFPGYAESVGKTAVLGAAMISAAMIGNIIFKLLIGVLSDRIGPINACSILVLVNLSSLTILSLTDPAGNYALTMAAAFLFGSIYAVGAVGSSLLTRRVFGVERYASTYPYVSMCMGIGSASSVSIIGFLYDFFRTYRVGIAFGIGFGIVNLALLQTLRIKRSRVG
ncbi:MAG: MFS transporter [Treponemataceae bacterium]